MRLTRPQIEIAYDEGFSKNDIFKRADFGERLASLIENSNENIVIALDAPWGEGKSTFIKMWKGYIEHHRKNSFKAIYFDAFANDYQKEPFLALAAEIYDLLKEEHSSKKKEFKKKASNAIKSLARGAISIGVKAATAGLLDKTDFDDVKEDIAKELSDRADKLLSARLQNSEKDKEALKEFKKYLTDLAKNENGGRPLVFIIDELDRCRPDFALELIEQIKHLFSVEGITFLLVMNRSQLEAAVSNRYGQNVKTAIYLQKFINLWLALPRKYGEANYGADDGKKYFNYALTQMMVNDEKLTNEFSKRALEELIILNRPSYREIEHMLAYFALLQNMSNHITYKNALQLFIAYICYIKAVKPGLIESIRKNSISLDALFKETGLYGINTDGLHAINELIQYIRFDMSDEGERARMKAANAIDTYDYGRVPRERTMSMICGWLDEITATNI